MDIPFSIEADRKKTKKCAWTATIIYLLFFPFLFMFAAASIMIFDSPRMPVPLGLSIIFMYFCIPFSIPFTFYFIWSRYSQAEYKKSRQFCLIPLYILLVTFIFDVLMDAIRTIF